MTVAVGAAGVDGGDVDGQLDGGVGRVDASTWAVPSKLLNCPRTLVTIAWRATNPRREWDGSIV